MRGNVGNKCWSYGGQLGAMWVPIEVIRRSYRNYIGAHNIFLGQVRADEINEKTIRSIQYTAYKDMANQKFHEIREAAFSKFNLSCMHIYHSLGEVKVGEICLFVFASSPRRKEVFKALEYVVEEIKADVPIFGKELFEDNTHQWKVNS